jgi:uncharacterized protein
MKYGAVFKKYANTTTHKIAAREPDYLYTRESQIPGAGSGLFTAIPVYRHEVIAIFKGKILSDQEAALKAAKGKDAYFINMPDGTILDAIKKNSFAKYANDAAGLVKSAFRNNSKITLNEDGHVCVVASRKIKAGEEIFCSYGVNYWKKHAEDPVSDPLSQQVKSPL